MRTRQPGTEIVPESVVLQSARDVVGVVGDPACLQKLLVMGSRKRRQQEERPYIDNTLTRVVTAFK